MSPSSGDTHCEERWMSTWLITGVLSKVVHIDTFGSTGSNNSKLQVSEKNVLRKIFEPLKAEEAGDFSILCNEELHGLCKYHNIVRTIIYDVTMERQRLHTEFL
jgi:hypothetical protein